MSCAELSLWNTIAARLFPTAQGRRLAARPAMYFLCMILPLFLGTFARGQAAFSDDFTGGTLNTAKWKIATYNSPDSKPGINAGHYVASAIDLSQGMLSIRVSQRPGSDAAVESQGGAIVSRDLFGFGTYDFEMRMSNSSPTPDGKGQSLTGAVSSGFIYCNKSESEIDLEFLGNENAIWVSTWHNLNPAYDPTSQDRVTQKVSDSSLAARFRHYTLVWKPESVDVYIDGRHVTHQTEHVPQTPAHIILQHRGTNSDRWGGVASPGADRYFYVRSVKYIP